MISAYICTSTRSGRGKRRSYIRHAYYGNIWKEGIDEVRSLLRSLPKRSKGIIMSDVTGITRIITKRTIREV